MDAPHLSIAVRSSFDQCLALIVLASTCCLSLFAWPDFSNFWLFLCFCFTLELLVGFFAYQLYRLQYWRCAFTLSDIGAGVLFLNEESNQGVSFSPNVRFTIPLESRRLITPLVLVFYIDLLNENDDCIERRLILIWSDMLDIPKYRHLCRILVSNSN